MRNLLDAFVKDGTLPGSGYTGATLQIAGVGSGTGAVFSLATEPSSILSATVTNGGRHYSYANIVVTSPTGSGATFTTAFTPVPQYNGYVNVGRDMTQIIFLLENLLILTLWQYLVLTELLKSLVRTYLIQYVKLSNTLKKK